MGGKYRRYFLKPKETKSILNKAAEKLRVDLTQILEMKIQMERIETGFADIFLINEKPLLVRIDERILPTLVFTELFAFMPRVVVDMGAVPHICNGANVMAPGIVQFEKEFDSGEFVTVADEKHGKIIAIGEAVYDCRIAKETLKGVIIMNIHFVGDKIWNFIKKIVGP